jgi:dTDP-4-dehydrorhamnose 3,5-epimerase
VPEDELAVAWNDPEIGIAWPIEHPTLSPKDAAAPRRGAIAVLPVYPEAAIR